MVRGNDWSWEIRNGGPNSLGTVVSEGVDSDGHVWVKWDKNGKEYWYSMGWNGEYEVKLASLPGESSSTAAAAVRKSAFFLYLICH